MFSSKTILVVLCVFSGSYGDRPKQLYEGDACKMAVSRAAGTCISLLDCPPALDALNRGRNPQMCIYRGFMPIVCCKNTSDVSIRGQMHQEQVLPLQIVANRVADEMCDCYRDFDSPNVLECEDSVNSGFKASISPESLVDPRLRNGHLVDEREFPHMVALGYPNQDTGVIEWGCGGSLISSRHVLTAGHCLVVKRVNVTVVRIGDVNIKNASASGSGQDFEIAETIPYPDYSRNAYYYDIALLTLKKSVIHSEYARPACLNTVMVQPLTTCIATGWGGNNWENTEGSDYLMKITLRMEPSHVCNTTFQDLILNSTQLVRGVDNRMLCAADPSGNQDTCKGDSGGPIQVKTTKYENMYNIIGITSFGSSCITASTTSVYTRVDSYIPWLVSKVWPQRIPRAPRDNANKIRQR